MRLKSAIAGSIGCYWRLLGRSQRVEGKEELKRRTSFRSICQNLAGWCQGIKIELRERCDEYVDKKRRRKRRRKRRET